MGIIRQTGLIVTLGKMWFKPLAKSLAYTEVFKKKTTKKKHSCSFYVASFLSDVLHLKKT